MTQHPDWDFSRRNFLISGCGFLIPRPKWGSALPGPVLSWPLQRLSGAQQQKETRSGETVIAGTGRLEWVPAEPDAELPRLDGYSVWFEQEVRPPIRLDRGFSLSAWLALESFPVNSASVMEWGSKAEGVALAIDRLGFPVVEIRSNGSVVRAKGPVPVETGRWLHLAGTGSTNCGLTLFLDGEEIAREHAPNARPALADITHVYLARAQDCEIVAKVFPTGVLNGFLRDVRIYPECLARSDIHELSREFQRVSARLATNPAWFAEDRQRPRYHAMPPRAWTNEPHGLVRWRGEYHLFYQKNPDGPYWGHIHWGHMTSPDLLHWVEQPIALTPEPGPDSEGCWSGSAIVVGDKLHLIYTGGDGRRASICMATSEDGIHFIKHHSNPIISSPPAGIGVKEFRDPFIWKQGAEYRMIIGSGIEGVGGTALLYRSPDLASWHFVRPLLIGSKETSGVFWEMPVFIPIGTFYVLIVCEVPGRASYWVGKWEDDEFHLLSDQPRRLDLINHFLSPTPYVDTSGRVITIGIVPDSRDSREAWQAGWAHLYGLPRELTLDEAGNLQQRPFSGLAQRFTEVVPTGATLSVGENWFVCDGAGTCLRFRVAFERNQSETVVLAFRRAPDEEEVSIVRYAWEAEQLSMDRRKSSINPHVFQNLQQCSYTPLKSGEIAFDIFLDGSVLEVFIDQRACFSTRIYPALPESVGIALRAESGSATVTHLSFAAFREDRSNSSPVTSATTSRRANV